MKKSTAVLFDIRKDAGALWRIPLQNQKGIALIMILLFLVLLAILSVAAITTTSSEIQRTASYVELKTAFYIADAGIEHAKSVIKYIRFDSALAGADGDKAATADNGVLSLDGPADAVVDFNNGSYSVLVSDNDDGDGDIDDDSDGIVIIASTGTTAKGNSKTITAMVKKYDLDPNDFPAAVTMPDPDVDIDMNSNAYLIQGNGSYRNPNPPYQALDDPSCPDKHGIATLDDVPETDYSPANSVDKIQGVGGPSGDILTGDTTFTLLQLQEIRNTYLPFASAIYTGTTNLSDATLGTYANPQVTYVNDSLTINGNVSGAGILIVDRDFRVNGSFVFQGIILIGICDTCPGRFETGSGNAKIYGAIVVANPTSSFDVEARLKMTGNASIYYSCKAIDNANNLSNKTFSVVSWNG
ncbi:MAG: PilX N-terminal domain-containing pilus assembly protein [Nitrospinales bacterium]